MPDPYGVGGCHAVSGRWMLPLRSFMASHVTTYKHIEQLVVLNYVCVCLSNEP